MQVNLGGPYFSERDFTKAIELYQKALQRESRGTSAHGFLAWAYEADGQHDKALDDYEAYEKAVNKNLVETEAKYRKYKTLLHRLFMFSYGHTRPLANA